MKIDLARINPIAVLVGFLSIVLCAIAISVAIVIDGNTSALNAARDATQAQTQETTRWQAEAPGTLAAIRTSAKTLATVCRSSLNTNALLLHILYLINKPENHVTGTLDDMVATYPSPTPTPAPSASATPQGLSSLPQNAKPNVTFTPHPLLGAQSDHTGSYEADLVEFRRNLTVNGTYPDVVRALTTLNEAGVPIRLEPPSIDRLGDHEITLKAAIEVFVPSPGACAMALTPSDKVLVGATLPSTIGAGP